MGEYDRLRGWNLSARWPTPEKRRELFLEKEMKSFSPGWKGPGAKDA